MSPKRIEALKNKLRQHINEPENDVVSEDLLCRMDEARDYDCATSYGYLYLQLMIIKHAVSRGRKIKIATEPPEILDSIKAFSNWASRRYPGVKSRGHYDLSIDPSQLVD